MTRNEKFEAITCAYKVKHRESDNKDIQVISDETPEEVLTFLLDIQHDLDAGFELSYDIVSDAAGIIADLTIDGLEDVKIDLYAEADSRANVYTMVQLSYLSLHNEAEISDLMKDESITSVAQACAAWYTQKVVDACNSLIDYINGQHDYTRPIQRS